MVKKKQITVLGHKVLIKYQDLSLHGLEGYFDPLKSMIVINTKQDPKAMMLTLMHELIHAICHHSALGQTSMSRDVEEIVAEQVSTQFGQIFDIKIK